MLLEALFLSKEKVMWDERKEKSGWLVVGYMCT